MALWLLRMLLSHDKDTIHGEKRYVEMCDFCMVALMFLTGHGIKAKTHAHVEIAHLQTRCTIRTWKALSLQPHASHALVMHIIGEFLHGHGFLLYYSTGAMAGRRIGGKGVLMGVCTRSCIQIKEAKSYPD